jgi:hypothetical protein
MIDIEPLERTGMNTSKNPCLLVIWSMINTYNSIATSLPPPPVVTPEVRRSMLAPQLTTALQFVTTWITEKPPKATATNTARWDALRQLAEEIGVEAEQLGLRFLTAPSNLKNVGNPVPGSTKSRSYWLEYLDTAHRPGWILSEKYEQWLASNSAQSFWDHIGAPPPNTQKVKYYGGTPKALKRRVFFGHSTGLESMHPLHSGLFSTENLSTVFSGKGWGIFVVDLDQNLYIHKHIEGKYHHSTFLSGGAVSAAGEIAVEDGWVRVITAKSGHYMPTVANMQRFVQTFPLILGNAVIRPDFGDTRGGAPAKCYYVGDFRRDGTAAPTLKRAEVMHAIPAFAQTAEAQRWINRVPV